MFFEMPSIIHPPGWVFFTQNLTTRPATRSWTFWGAFYLLYYEQLFILCLFNNRIVLLRWILSKRRTCLTTVCMTPATWMIMKLWSVITLLPWVWSAMLCMTPQWYGEVIPFAVSNPNQPVHIIYFGVFIYLYNYMFIGEHFTSKSSS